MTTTKSDAIYQKTLAAPVLAGLTMGLMLNAFDGYAAIDATMGFQNFDGPTVPINKAGFAYPIYYSGTNEGGVFAGSIDTTNKIAGVSSLRMHVTSGSGLYAQFNPYDANGRGFAREYASNPAAWKFNTYNRMRYWLFNPANGAPERSSGMQNFYMGTYVKKVTNADSYSDESGGGHYYHPFNILRNSWSMCTLNMHPGHGRGEPGGVDTGNTPYPTSDPANTYNYFDALTRWYISAEGGTGLPMDYGLDEIDFYREAMPENDEQVYSICVSYTKSNNRFFVTWNRHKDENNVNHELRYAFSDIHVLGWDKATAAPNGTIAPPGWQGYNGMVYDTTAIDVTGRSEIYLAIKPNNSTTFSQVAFPLSSTTPPASLEAPRDLQIRLGTP